MSSILEKLEIAQGIKEDGNMLFGAGEYRKATKKYLMVFLYTRGLPGSKRGLEGPAQMALQGSSTVAITPEEESIAIELEASVHLNIATSQIRLNVPLKALEHANKAIELKPNYWKAHLRKAEAHLLFGDFEKSAIAFDRASSLISPEDKAGKSGIANARSRLLVAEKDAKRKQQKEWAGVFSK